MASVADLSSPTGCVPRSCVFDLMAPGEGHGPRGNHMGAFCRERPFLGFCGGKFWGSDCGGGRIGSVSGRYVLKLVCPDGTSERPPGFDTPPSFSGRRRRFK